MSRRKAAAAKKSGFLEPKLTKAVEELSLSRGELNLPKSVSGDQAFDHSGTKFSGKKYGSLGIKENVEVNLFKITINKPKVFYHFNIEIVGEEGVEIEAPDNSKKLPRSKKTKKELNDLIFRSNFEQNKVFKVDILPVFDGEKNFYSLQEFNLENNGIWSGVVKIKDGDKEKNIRVNITTPEVSHVQNFSKIIPKVGKIISEIMPVEQQALDIILKNGARSQNKLLVGANMFSKQNSLTPQEIFELNSKNQRVNPFLHGRFGTYQATKICENGLYLNVDRSIQLFNKGGKLINLLEQFKFGLTKKAISAGDKKLVMEKIKGLKFKALHLKNEKKFTITGLSNQSIKEIEFDTDEGKINVFDYFKKTYPDFFKSSKIADYLPCVEVRGFNGRTNSFPIECVEISNDEVFKKKLDKSMQEIVTKESSQKPQERFENIQNHVKTLERDNIVNKIDYFKQFGEIKINTTPEIVECRIIESPKIQFGGKKFVVPRNGNFDIKDNLFYQPAKGIGSNWALINFKENDNITSVKIETLLDQLILTAKKKGMDFSRPKRIQQFEYQGLESLQNLFAQLEQNVKFALLIIPDSSLNYAEIKSVSELQCYKEKLITQCLNSEKKYWNLKPAFGRGQESSKNVSKFSNQLILNVLLKINTKLGGVNQTIEENSRAKVMKTKSRTMFLGIDVTHPSPNDDNLPHSISACVATFTDDYVKCFKDIKIQEKARKEVVNLKKTMKIFLEDYNKVNKCYPLRIIVYRDGIGEGDFQKIIDIELAGIKDACKELKQGEIKVTYIMVQKRHNVRFKRTNKGDADHFNLLPGSVIDQKITSNKFFEFYLNSHDSPLGTGRPGKYVVLHDENDMNADELQKMTFSTAFLYPRCLKSISIPAFVEYAHHLCTRGRYYLRLVGVTGVISQNNRGDTIETFSDAQIAMLNEKLAIRKNLSDIPFFV